MPRTWRLCKTKWAGTAFSGNGAAQFPGRWNSAGQKIIYTASSQALAALEMLAHVEDRSYLRRAQFVIIPVDIPDALVQIPKRLPSGWAHSPPLRASQKLGDRFIATALMPVLRVPSAVVPEEFNYLLNPLHADFSKITVGRPERFRFDPRLI